MNWTPERIEAFWTIVAAIMWSYIIMTAGVVAIIVFIEVVSRVREHGIRGFIRWE